MVQAPAGNFAPPYFLTAEVSSMGTQRKKVSRWSARVTRESNALDLEQGVFGKGSPKEIARSLQRSAERSKRRKTDAFRSAMSMLVFYMNRAGKNLSASRQQDAGPRQGRIAGALRPALRPADQSILAPVRSTTRAHFAISARR
jgi:hypothetical protein